MLPQSRLDLPQFYAEAVDLDLKIVAAEELDVPVGQPAREIPGAVHARVRIIGKQVREKPLLRQLRPVQIPARHLYSADIEFPGHSHRRRLLILIQDVDPGVRYWLADRHHRTVKIRRAVPAGHINSRFSRTIEVVQLCLWYSLP